VFERAEQLYNDEASTVAEKIEILKILNNLAVHPKLKPVPGKGKPNPAYDISALLGGGKKSE